MKELYSLAEVADMVGCSKETLRRWERAGKLKAERNPINQYRYYRREELEKIPQCSVLFHEKNPEKLYQTERRYKTIELFAGAGGLAVGFEKAGFNHVLLNEFDHSCCETLRKNRPDWNIVEGDIANVDFTPYQGQIDVITGGFPCQAFSYAGERRGFEDARGTLFYEFARAIKECQPKVAIGENVRGLLTHDGGKTIKTMVGILEDLGYVVLAPHLLKAIFYRVPQKRERLAIVAIRKDLFDKGVFNFPEPESKVFTLRDAFKKGELFDSDVPLSAGQQYPEKKKQVLEMVPPGGYWRDLPVDVQKAYMMKSYYLGGGKTGMARRLSWDEPSLTLTCAPAQKQTERCHPEETRPLTVREYARVQTFPDEWEFAGSMTSQYKQIGNAVPVNLAHAIASSVAKFLDGLPAEYFTESDDSYGASGHFEQLLLPLELAA